MAIPAKPTQRLAVDGIIGQKTRDAAAYAFRRDRFTHRVKELKDLPDGIVLNLQIWMNTHTYWKKLPVSGSTSRYYRWEDYLVTDGEFGAQSAAKLGGSITWLTNGWSPGYIDDILIPAGRSIRCFQALLNGMIFREKPRGPGIKYVNSSVEWDNRDYRWAHRPGVFG